MDNTTRFSRLDGNYIEPMSGRRRPPRLPFWKHERAVLRIPFWISRRSPFFVKIILILAALTLLAALSPHWAIEARFMLHQLSLTCLKEFFIWILNIPYGSPHDHRLHYTPRVRWSKHFVRSVLEYSDLLAIFASSFRSAHVGLPGLCLAGVMIFHVLASNGLTILMASRRVSESEFDTTTARMSYSILIVGFAPIVVVKALHIALDDSSTAADKNEIMLTLSRAMAIPVLLVYPLALLFRYITHAVLYFEDFDPQADVIGPYTVEDGTHLEGEIVVQRLPRYQKFILGVLVLPALAGLFMSAEWLLSFWASYHSVLHEPITGLLLFPLLSNSGAVLRGAAVVDHTELGFVLFDDRLAFLMLGIFPAAILLAWAFALKLTYEFDIVSTSTIVLAWFVGKYSMAMGKTHWLIGALYLCLYSFYILAILLSPAHPVTIG